MSLLHGVGAGLGGSGDAGGALGGGGILGSHTVSQSLRLNGVDAYLSRAGSDLASSTNTSKRTFSTWFKTSVDSYVSQTQIYGAGGTGIDGFGLTSSEKIQIYRAGVNTHDGTRVIRDTTAWYHFLYLWNHTDTIYNFYINGELDATGSTTGAMAKIGNSGHLQTIGKRSNQGTYINGYLAETVFLDGYIGSVSDFGETVDGVWVPKDISAAGLTYGANGFYLDYADSSDLGKDVSGQDNHFTSNNISAEDQVADSPTNNFATMNTMNKASTSVTLKEGGLATATMSSANGSAYSTVTATTALPRSGQWYWEADFTGQVTSGSQVAMAGLLDARIRVHNNVTQNYFNGSTSNGDYITWYGYNNDIRNGNQTNTYTSAIATQTAGTVSFAVDMDNLWVWVAVNGTWINGTPDFSDGTNKVYDLTAGVDYLPFYGSNGGSSVSWTAFNFGQGGKTFSSAQQPDDGVGNFEYTVPTGYKALCTLSLPDTTISPGKSEQADDYFNTVLWSGDGSSSRGITGVGHAPDWVWIKQRSSTQTHQLLDSLRGRIGSDSSFARLRTDTTAVQETPGTDLGLLSLDSDGFTIGSDSAYNASSATYVSWNWKLGGAPTATNSAGAGATPTAGSVKIDGSNLGSALAGSIPATKLSASTASGVSIVTFTGNATAGATVAHGLSSAPELVVVKAIDATTNWTVYHSGIASDAETDYISWDVQNDKADLNTAWNDTAPTNTVFSLGTFARVNADTEPFIAFCFHSVEGFSKFSHYTGNNNPDGTSVYLGFRPAYVWVRRIGAGADWEIYDNKRYAFNKAAETQVLEINENGKETDTVNELDFLANGFKLRSSNTFSNASSRYIYAAFAETPFKFSNAR